MCHLESEQSDPVAMWTLRDDLINAFPHVLGQATPDMVKSPI